MERGLVLSWSPLPRSWALLLDSLLESSVQQLELQSEHPWATTILSDLTSSLHNLRYTIRQLVGRSQKWEWENSMARV
jgi:hypothetical protein